MKIGERGQVPMPKHMRENLGLAPTIRKSPAKLNVAKWKGECGKRFAELGYTSVDEFIEEIRGR